MHLVQKKEKKFGIIDLTQSRSRKGYFVDNSYLCEPPCILYCMLKRREK